MTAHAAVKSTDQESTRQSKLWRSWRNNASLDLCLTFKLPTKVSACNAYAVFATIIVLMESHEASIDKTYSVTFTSTGTGFVAFISFHD